MSSGKDGKDGKEGAIAKAAGIAVASGVAWSIFRFFKARKEEDALIQEYYGDREDFAIPAADRNDKEIHDVYVEEAEVEVVNFPPPPFVKAPLPPVLGSAPDLEVVKTEIREEVKVIEEFKVHEPKPQIEEKPWFFCFFNSQKQKESKPKFKENKVFEVNERKSESYEIKRGDTLWAISGKYGVSLDSLKATNGIYGDRIYAGDKLVIPPK